MLYLLFLILLVGVFWKLVKLAIKMTWGISKIIVFLVLLPLILIGMVIAGLMYFAIPILVIVGIVALIKN